MTPCRKALSSIRVSICCRFFRSGCAGVLLPILLGLWGCSSSSAPPPKPQAPVPVSAAPAVQKNVPLSLQAIGTVEAYAVVAVKSQVGGEILKVHFREGQEVKKNDLLFTIDPRPFEAAVRQSEALLARDQSLVTQAEANLAKDRAQVKQAEANLLRDVAQLENAQEEARRYAFLAEKGFVAREQYDQIQTRARALEATVQADQAAVENARAAVTASQAALENARAAVRASQAALENVRIQLGYCFLRAPFSGRLGNLNVQGGNVIKANDATLVTLKQIHPIYVSFSVPEQHLAEIKRYMAAADLRVEALIPGGEDRAEKGVLTFVDNAVDPSTGTIRLKATFQNAANRLWPGQFVNVALFLSVQPGAVVLPSRAVQTGQEGPFVFVVGPDMTVEVRPVTAGRKVDGETVIDRGVRAGERVVTGGQLRLYPGAKVEIKAEPGQGGKPR